MREYYAEAVRLFREGNTPGAIAELLGKTPSSVYAMLGDARKEGALEPDEKTRCGVGASDMLYDLYEARWRRAAAGLRFDDVRLKPQKSPMPSRLARTAAAAARSGGCDG
jgi:hypothetical protein